MDINDLFNQLNTWGKRVSDLEQSFRRHKHLGQAYDQSETLGDDGGSPSTGRVIGRIYASASQSIPNTAYTNINLGTEDYAEGITTDLPNSHLVIEEDGYYFVSGQVTFDTPVPGKLFAVVVSSNVTDIAYSGGHSGYTNLLTVKASSTVYLTAGQYISLKTFQNSGGNEDTAQGKQQTFLEIFKI